MIVPTPSASAPQPAIMRLAALAPLDKQAISVLDHAIGHARSVPQRRELLTEGRPVPRSMLIVAGWAARVRIFTDGQRQFLSFLLPGDLIGLCRQPQPLAVSTVVALTDVMVCDVPPPGDAPALGHAYAMSGALEEAYLLGHIARLGRLSAQDRIADLMLELHERLTLNGMVEANGFALPLTQEVLGDALGLTSVHVNRMIQSLRRNGDVTWKNGRLTLNDPEALSAKIGRAPARVSSSEA